MDEGKPESRYFMQLAGAGLDVRAVELVSWKLKKMPGRWPTSSPACRRSRKNSRASPSAPTGKN